MGAKEPWGLRPLVFFGADLLFLAFARGSYMVGCEKTWRLSGPLSARNSGRGLV